MPSALVTALAAPIRRVQELVGPGRSGDLDDPEIELGGVRDMLADVAYSAQQAWHRTGPGWSGAGAEAAAEFAAATAAAIDAAADRAANLGVTVEHASDAVARAHRRLQQIVDEFEARASALEPRLDTPGVAKELLTESREALAEAISVVEELLVELDHHAAALEAAAPATPGGNAAGTVPAGFSGTGSGASPGLGSSALGAPTGWGGPGSGAELAGFIHEGGRESADESMFGDGVTVRLPDGTVVLAPNALAAGAVRHALTQLGVPYQWGGTSPDVGLDCSGLTQWAYREAGLDIPRLAQEQDIGAAVAPGALLPGDLAVWDGHVAMIVGNGTMIEAGDPVQLSPIRTSNASQGFQGFWRPTG